MMTAFGRDDVSMIGAVMTDSLCRAGPARFSGFNLSRCCRAVFPAGWAAPQPHVNFGPRPCRCKDFLSAGWAASHPSTVAAQERRRSAVSNWVARRISAVPKQWKAVRLRVGKPSTPHPDGVTTSRSSRAITNSTPTLRPAGWRDNRSSHPSYGARQGRSSPQAPAAEYDPIPA